MNLLLLMHSPLPSLKSNTLSVSSSSFVSITNASRRPRRRRTRQGEGPTSFRSLKKIIKSSFIAAAVSLGHVVFSQYQNPFHLLLQGQGQGQGGDGEWFGKRPRGKMKRLLLFSFAVASTILGVTVIGNKEDLQLGIRVLVALVAASKGFGFRFKITGISHWIGLVVICASAFYIL